MQRDNIIYWATTLIIFGVMMLGGVMDIVQPEGFAENVASLGYPLYFFTILGVFKIIGSILLVVPKVSMKLKELAYAGFFFDLVYAALSHGAIGEYAKILPPVAFLVILAVSYKYKNKVIS
ncbi:DoxX family protein [Allomuricauda sp. ARW1Y1]|jgi:uncharacterized membrane protein|uniref:DoxX family protein n=1 Tax=Allomuricauda sp. ARW1Y1 TaxID=2663843 RepID=UPI0015C71C60|nr:DoxX family protein [Muricauda sp. ARW1Y1]NYJ28085.1 putative membrane protein [Muricauda sp. ARW1Y1]